MGNGFQRSDDRELLALCEAVCLGQATDQQAAELEQRMHRDRAVAKTYLDYAALHADLLQITSAQNGGRAVARYVRTQRSGDTGLALPGRRMWAWVAVVSAALLIAATVTLWRSSDENHASLRSGEVFPEIDGMAVVSHIEAVTWSQGAHVFEEGQLLRSRDWVAIESGHLEIEFGQGAVVVLEGPARFAARSTSVGKMRFGKLAAVVPPWAEGFRVDTSTLTVVDRGTKFELEVTRDHRVDVAVTKGEVALLQSGSVLPFEQTVARLTEGQAVRAHGDSLESIAAGKLPRMLSDRLPFRPDDAQVEVVAKYRRDFVDGMSSQPRNGGSWHYLTNGSTPIGEVGGYSELLWDTKRRVYDPNGDRGELAGSRLYAANLSYRGGHPGSGRDQTKDDLDHYVIAAYDMPRDGSYRIESGWLVRRESREDIANQAVDLIVHLNENAAVFRETCNRDGLLRFSCPLGSRRQGDRVYIAVGPSGVDFNDRFEWDFAIVRQIDPGESTTTATPKEEQPITGNSDLWSQAG